MRSWLRRVRGMIGIGLTWAVAWSIAGLVPRLLLGINPDAPLPVIFGMLGFVAGVTFSGLLLMSESRRKFDQLSLARFAVWGVAGGLLLAAIFAKVASLAWRDVLVVAPVFAIASAACAAGTLVVARRATRGELGDLLRHDAALTDANKPGLL